MRRIVMLFAVLLGTTMMANASTITTKATTSKEAKAHVVRKHKRHRKATSKKAEVSKPITKGQN